MIHIQTQQSKVIKKLTYHEESKKSLKVSRIFTKVGLQSMLVYLKGTLFECVTLIVPEG